VLVSRQTADRQVCAGHEPQFTSSPQLLVTVPHLGAGVPIPHVTLSLCGKQQTGLAGRVSQTSSVAQQTLAAPVQQTRGVGQSVPGLLFASGV
jgi:hypothetical protein